jgi:RNA polymerase sigma factor (TIGR02999 family)
LLADFPTPESLNQLIRLVYQELRGMASRHFRGERPDHTLQPTALVHEAIIRLIKTTKPYKNRAHFFGSASKAMRRILIERARRHNTHKRGAGWRRVDLLETQHLDVGRPRDLLDFDSALLRLASLDKRLSQIVELRAVCGFTAQQTADFLGLGESTVRKRWAVATKWLREELGDHH